MARKSKASEDLLAQLHAMTAQQLLTLLKDGEVVSDREGNLQRVTISAATMNVIVKFLKDNGVVGADEANTAVRDLAKELKGLPEFDQNYQ